MWPTAITARHFTNVSTCTCAGCCLQNTAYHQAATYICAAPPQRARHPHLIIAVSVHEVRGVALQLQAAVDGLRVVVCSTQQGTKVCAKVASVLPPATGQTQLGDCNLIQGASAVAVAPTHPHQHTCAQLVEHQHLEAWLRPALDEEQRALNVFALLQAHTMSKQNTRSNDNSGSSQDAADLSCVEAVGSTQLRVRGTKAPPPLP